jgi:hypothetical protein
MVVNDLGFHGYHSSPMDLSWSAFVASGWAPIISCDLRLIPLAFGASAVSSFPSFFLRPPQHQLL